jgi:hypothetical protein
MFTPTVEAYLRATVIPLRLACLTADGGPLVLSLWYIYRDRKLYCATRSGAQVAGYLRADPRCGYEIAGDEPPYCGVRGRAEATIDSQIGESILVALLKRYLGGTDSPLARNLLKYADDEVALVIRPTSLFTWNYADRMRESVDGIAKVCP